MVIKPEAPKIRWGGVGNLDACNMWFGTVWSVICNFY